MKRSKRSQLVRLALIGAPLLVAAGCGEKDTMEKALIYPDVKACKADGKMTDEACEREFDHALVEHYQKAPRYNSQADCEADFGAAHCERQQFSEGSVFLPMMAGFMAASALNNLRAPAAMPASALNGQGCDPQRRDQPGCANNAGSTGGSTGFRSHIGSGSSWRGQPLYKSSDDRDSWRTADNRYVSRFSGESYISHSTTSSEAGARSVSRGGFGRTAAAHSSSSSFHSSGS